MNDISDTTSRTEGVFMPRGGGVERLLSDFVCKVDMAESADDIIDSCEVVTSALGFPRMLYGWTSSPIDINGKWAAVPLITRGYPAGWDSDWPRFQRHDPYFRTAFQFGDTDWESVWAQREQLCPMQRACMDYVADFGLRQGLTIPVRRRQRFAFLTVMADHGDKSFVNDKIKRDLPILKILANYVDGEVSIKDTLQYIDSPTLSNREKECLNWSSIGKTVDEIATILDISPDTIRVYLKRIYTKLSVTNRTHAVARAISLGLIEQV